MKLQEFFLKNPIFYLEDLVNQSRCSYNTVKNTIAHHVNKGHVVRIKRGLYASIPYGGKAQSYPINPYLIAGYMAKDAIIAYHSALAYYGCSYSDTARYIFLSESQIREQFFREQVFKSVPYPKALVLNNSKDIFVNSEDINGKLVRITSLERSFVDIIDRPDLEGGWEEVTRVIQMIEKLNVDRVIQYTSLLGNKTTTAKVGYILENNSSKFCVSKNQIKLLAKNIPLSPLYISRKSKENQFISNWNIFIPTKDYTENWSEKLF